jgi:hypothetical protein
MTDFNSSEEFHRALRGLIDKWCDERRLKGLARLLPGYLGFNGLTDGWHELRAALVAARAADPDADRAQLGDLIRFADNALTRR